MVSCEYCAPVLKEQCVSQRHRIMCQHFGSSNRFRFDTLFCGNRHPCRGLIPKSDLAPHQPVPPNMTLRAAVLGMCVATFSFKFFDFAPEEPTFFRFDEVRTVSERRRRVFWSMAETSFVKELEMRCGSTANSSLFLLYLFGAFCRHSHPCLSQLCCLLTILLSRCAFLMPKGSSASPVVALVADDEAHVFVLQASGSACHRSSGRHATLLRRDRCVSVGLFCFVFLQLHVNAAVAILCRHPFQSDYFCRSAACLFSVSCLVHATRERNFECVNFWSMLHSHKFTSRKEQLCAPVQQSNSRHARAMHRVNKVEVQFARKCVLTEST